MKGAVCGPNAGSRVVSAKQASHLGAGRGDGGTSCAATVVGQAKVICAVSNGASILGRVKNRKIRAVWSKLLTESPFSAGFVRMEELVVSDISLSTPGEEQAAAKVAPAGNADKKTSAQPVTSPGLKFQ